MVHVVGSDLRTCKMSPDLIGIHSIGDPFDERSPRDNENGGKYGRGVIVRSYKMGQVDNKNGFPFVSNQ